MMIAIGDYNEVLDLVRTGFTTAATDRLSLAYQHLVAAMDEFGTLAQTYGLGGPSATTSTPTLTPAPTPTPTPLTFNLIGYSVVSSSSSGLPSLKITFTGSDIPKVFRLINPAGEQTGYDYTNQGESTAFLGMADYRGRYVPGEYELITENVLGKQIASNLLPFVGAQTSITGLSLSWEKVTYWGLLPPDYSLNILSVDIMNSGDLPSFVSIGQIYVDGQSKGSPLFYPISWPGVPIFPGTGVTLYPSYASVTVSEGTHTLTLELYDATGQLVCAHSTSIIPYAQ
jgi:hypothetical protein